MGRPRRAPDETTPSIYKGYDGLWHARVAMRIRADGSTERKHVRRKDRAELVKVVRGLERSRDNGSYAWTEDDPTLAQWIEHWLSAILPMSARPKTLATYRSQMVRHLLPALGHCRLSELRPEHLENLYISLGHDGASVPTIRAVHRVVRSALNEAIRRRRLLHNPAQVARPPRLIENEADPLTVDECRRVLEEAATKRNGPRWAIALSLGLRQGEALGLLWSDLDLDDGTLTVRRSAQRLTWQHGC
ncbi:N-terminal phage integrase SAM-like domain-containing protein [Nocardioidaceae bacterium SCSIO 66511]|nr:N-terminal phage integrase SAM-like domain-containing protein [Nocardioidaceae bacterium SCSIO 66511]